MRNFLTFALLIFITFPSYSIRNSNQSIIRHINPIPKKKTCKTSKQSFTHFNPYKMGSFCRLIQIGNYKAVNTLINKGVDINKKSLKLTPLMYAARHNRVNILKLLIEKGAHLKTRSDNGFTALNWAKHANAKEAYEILLKAKKS